jgi:ParB family chromosome partitioning protein
MSRSPGLGRGLSALFGEVAQEQPVSGATATANSGTRTMAVADLRPHPGQPRRRFDEAALAELAGSIRRRGLIQPVLVRPVGSGFQIVAGERRWRAAQAAGLHEIPVIVREFDEAQTLEVAIVENVQREDLNAIEEAEAYQRLAAEFGHSHEEIAGFVGKSRSHVANLVRLLGLPDPVRAAVADGRLSMGHARALINVADAGSIAEDAIRRGLSVREVEALARGGAPAKKQRNAKPAVAATDDDSTVLARQLTDLLGVRVAVTHDGGAGEVVLSYSSLDQLDMICQRLSGGTI